MRMNANLLWIEGKRAESPSFVPALRKKGFQVEIVSSGKAALAYLASHAPDLAIINAASLRTSGKRICQAIRRQAVDLPILLISSPGHLPGKDLTCAQVVLQLPFTARKLVNRIHRLLPPEEGDALQVGPLRFDQRTRIVRCVNKEARLTPRLAHLLLKLMKNAGEVIEREQLFREVWNTDYTEDTRTLDVHISWLRRAFEENPRQPRHLKTVRGVGYRLDA
jgi:DNA-binding response OmpR family regulator